MPHQSPARATSAPAFFLLLLGCLPTASLAANCTDASGNMDLFDMCDGWSIAAVVLLSILAVVLLVRLGMACIKCERPAIEGDAAAAAADAAAAAPPLVVMRV